LRADQLEIAADGLTVAERDRFAVQHSIRHFVIIPASLVPSRPLRSNDSLPRNS
jgi:hypothetical protein